MVENFWEAPAFEIDDLTRLIDWASCLSIGTVHLSAVVDTEQHYAQEVLRFSAHLPKSEPDAPLIRIYRSAKRGFIVTHVIDAVTLTANDIPDLKRLITFIFWKYSTRREAEGT